MTEKENGRRLIEAGFPCHQVGAETQRERGASLVDVSLDVDGGLPVDQDGVVRPGWRRKAV